MQVWLQKLLYPQFADYNLQAEVVRYYKLFYGSDLNPSQYDALMAKEGAYFNLYQAQARNMDVDMDDPR